MSDIKIRKATVDDINQLLVFEQALIKYERPFDPTIKPEPVHYYDLNFMLAASHIHLVVAELANEIIGSGYARIDESRHFIKHTHFAYLGFMYVTPEHRGKGVNKLIMDSLKEWAASQGLAELGLEVYYYNQSAIKAYEKFGFKKHMIEMRYNLRGADE